MAVREAVGVAGIDRARVAGIGFDATCSLVVVDEHDDPVTVSTTGDDARNVIVWMDHRAVAEAAEITAGGHAPLAYVGGVMSPEMETPKLVWLKRNVPTSWQRAARVFDLPDFLVYRATGDDRRSMCSTVCKWTYVGHEAKWDDAFFNAIGLDDLVDEKFARIGTEVIDVGTPAGTGLTSRAADELHLVAGTAVSSSIIDAHAGGLGVLGSAVEGRVAIIFGTSACHLAVAREPRFVPGVWGPYFSALVPGLWLAEGGISAAGALLDQYVASHPAGRELTDDTAHPDASVFDLLNAALDRLAGDLPSGSEVTRDVHVLPYHLGNRSPLADATLRGAVTGLSLATDIDDLAIGYRARLQALAYATRHIIDALVDGGYPIDTIMMTGSGATNPVLVAEHADATGLPVVLPEEPDAVLLGAAILASVAAGHQPSIEAAMAAMSRAGQVIHPRHEQRAYHDAKYAVYRRMHADQLAYRELMQWRG